MTLKYSEEFRDNLREILYYIRQDNPQAAEHFKQKVKMTLQKLQDFPELGKAIDHPYFIEGTRRIVIDHYILFYSLEGNELMVASLFHGARDIERLLGRI